MITKLGLYLPKIIICSCDEFSTKYFRPLVFGELFSTRFPRFEIKLTVGAKIRIGYKRVFLTSGFLITGIHTPEFRLNFQHFKLHEFENLIIF